MLETFGKMLVGSFCLLAIYVIIASQITDWLRTHRERKAVMLFETRKEALRASRFKLYRRTHNSVTAVAFPTDFDECVKSYSIPSDGEQRNPWEPVIIRPKETYTFAKSEAERRPAHTGTMAELQQVMKVYMERMLRCSLSEYSEEQIRDLMKELSVEDERLFVPYAGNSPADGKKQFDYYRFQPLANFRDRLMAGV